MALHYRNMAMAACSGGIVATPPHHATQKCSPHRISMHAVVSVASRSRFTSIETTHPRRRAATATGRRRAIGPPCCRPGPRSRRHAPAVLRLQDDGAVAQDDKMSSPTAAAMPPRSAAVDAVAAGDPRRQLAAAKGAPRHSTLAPPGRVDPPAGVPNQVTGTPNPVGPAAAVSIASACMCTCWCFLGSRIVFCKCTE